MVNKDEYKTLKK